MIKKLLITIILLFLATILYTSLHEINKHDLSTQKAATCNIKEKGPIYLVTYGDGDVYIANTKILAESALNNCVDVVYMYRKEHLEKDFVEKNKKILEAKRGAGYWLWKPYIMLKTLEKIPENATVVYLDSGIKITNPLDRIINAIEDNDILLVDNDGRMNKEWIKRDVFKLMNMDNDEARNSKNISAGAFVIRNTPQSREFVSKWLEICEIDGALDDRPSIDEYPEFVGNLADQSILSLMWLQNKKGIKVIHMEDFLNDVYWHRRRGIEKSLFLRENIPMGFLDKRLNELLSLMRSINR